MRASVLAIAVVALNAALAQAQWVSNTRFADTKPLRYFPPRGDYRFVYCAEKTVRYERGDGSRIMVAGCPIGECVLGRNVIKPVIRYVPRRGAADTRVRIVVTVHDPGRPPRKCAEKTITVGGGEEGVETSLDYTIERISEKQYVVSEFFERDQEKPSVRVQTPCPLACLARVVLTRPKYWSNDPTARAWLTLNMDPHELGRKRARLELKSASGKTLKAHVFTKLTSRVLWFDADIKDVPPGKYSLVVTTLDERGEVLDTQFNTFVKTALPEFAARKTLPLVVEEARGIKRASFPACADIPFPDGELAAGHGTRLLDSSGKPVRAQFIPTGFWNERKSFVKWLRVGFNADTRRWVETHYTLEYGPGVIAKDFAAMPVSGTKPMVIDSGVLRGRVGAPESVATLTRGGLSVGLSGAMVLGGHSGPKTGPFRTVSGDLIADLTKPRWRFCLDPKDQGAKLKWDQPAFRDNQWRFGKVGVFWDDMGYVYRGFAWYRLTFTLTAEQARKDAFIFFGAVDERAWVYVNGAYIGGTGDKGTSMWKSPFQLPTLGKLKAGRNVIAVRVHNEAAAGGIWRAVGLFRPKTDRGPEGVERASGGALTMRFDTRSPARSTTDVDESGPMRTVLRTSGWYTDSQGRRSGKYQMRLYFFRDQPFVKLEHTFTFTEDANQFNVKELALKIRMPGLTKGRFGLDGGRPTKPLAPGVELAQLGSKRFVASTGLKGSRAAGWVEAQGSNGTVLAYLDHFWQNHPGALRLSDDGIEVVLYGGRGAKLLDLRNDAAHGSTYGGLGVAKTQTVWIWLPGRSLSSGEIASMTRAFAEPLRPVAPPKWACFSGITGPPVWPYDPKSFPNEEKQFAQAHDGIVYQRDWSDIFGWTDFGDVHHRWDRLNKCWDKRFRYWVNNESTIESTTSSHWLQYLRTGKRRYFDFPAERSMHLMDIDTCHMEKPGPLSGDVPAPKLVSYRPRPYELGVQHKHAINHWFTYAAPDHTYIDFALWHAHLSGGFRGFDVAAELASSIKRHPNAALGCQWRGYHFPARYAVDIYQHLWDEDLLSFAQFNLDVPLVHYPKRVVVGDDDRPMLSYDRYLNQTGDRWLRKRCIEDHSRGRFLAVRVDTTRAIMYYHLRDPSLMDLELFKRANYPGVTKSFKGAAIGDYKKTMPPGYGWQYFGVPKYAWTMWAFMDSGKMPEPPPPQVARTNGKGGGKWSDGATWQAGRLPEPAEAVLVAKEDAVIVDLPAVDTIACAGLFVEGKLTFADGAHTLAVNGDIRVRSKGEIRLGPGATLAIATPYLVKNGLIVETGGRLFSRGTSPEKPDASIIALGDKGKAAYTIFELKSVITIQNTTFRNFGITQDKDGRPRPQKYLDSRSGVFVKTPNIAPVTGNRFVDGGVGLDFYFLPLNIVIRDCEFRGCELGLNTRQNKRAKLIVESNRFVGNRVGAVLHLSQGSSTPGTATIKDNVFTGNTVAGLLFGRVGKCRIAVSGNHYEGNKHGLEVLGKGNFNISGETFLGNEGGVAVRDTAVLVTSSRFGSGGKPNTVADVVFVVGRRRNRTQTGNVTLRGCTLGSPAPVEKIKRHSKSWVVSEDHNGVRGKRMTWGRAPD